MKKFILLVLLSTASAMATTNLSAKETLDTLLPPPFWLRSRAEELNIDAQTRQQLEQIYQTKEPRYHEIKQQVQKLTKQLYTALIASELDEELITSRMKLLLEAENELKLYQIHVRISLLSQLTSEQRQDVRELARLRPEADWQGVLLSKVNRARTLSKQLATKGESIAEFKKRLQEIDKTIAAEKIFKASRMLDQVIRDLEESLK